MMDTMTWTNHADAAAVDQPWRRPGAARYAVERLRGIMRPPVQVYAPADGAVITEHDAPIALRGGILLRANEYRPVGDGPFPVLVCTPLR
jgi:uncharacterized protein